ncbi:MAG TPA: anti-sigma factor [Candidatus Cybelea sp.]|nr:anti-sigma factor [Candidatus Cybelea sp.]
MKPHDEMLDNVALYALGVLPPREAADVAAHLQSCEECRAEYQLLRPAVTAIGYAAEADGRTAGPSFMLKSRLMKQVRSTKPGGSASLGRSWAARWPSLVAAACIALAVGTALVNSTLRERAGRDESRIAQQSAIIADLTAPDAKRYRFGHGSVVVHGHNLYLAMGALAQPPKGKVYQAWTLPKGSKTMAPSITFKPGASGETFVRLPVSANSVVAVAVSVEPAGGSKQPTTKPIALALL